MNDMARRIIDKMLHPIYKELSAVKELDLEQSRKDYIEKMSAVGPVADHIDDIIT
jgi:hypothetical protein